MAKKVLPLIILAVIGLALSVGLALVAQTESPEDLIAQAEALFPERYASGNVERAIALYQRTLPQLETLSVQTQAFVLNRLAQLHYELATLRQGETPQDRELLEQGKAYGLRSLRLNPDFARWADRDFLKAARSVTDPAALLWTANNWGGIFSFDPLQGLSGVGKVKALYERCAQVDETYWGGSCHNALGALLVTTPKLVGGDLEAGRSHLERAVQVGPDYLMNRVVYAEYWGFTYDLFGQKNGVRDRVFVERQLRIVREAPTGERWPLWNRLAKREAERVLAELAEFADR